MKTTNTIISPMNGVEISSSKKISVEPLVHMGKPVINSHGKKVMNDRWIYINGSCVNRYRSMYCEKMALAEISIQESIGKKKLMDADLKLFVNRVSDKLVFEKFGKWYRVFLTKKTNRTFGIKRIVPYNFTIDPNRRIANHFSYQLCIDWKETFYI